MEIYMSEILATSPRQPHEAPTVEGRLADLFIRAEVVRIDHYKLSDADCIAVALALSAVASKEKNGTGARTITIKIPLIVTADGKWGANGGTTMKEPDWMYCEELCDFENVIVDYQRFFVEVTVQLPEIKEATGVAEPVETGE
jgi:hypothetical protein